MAAFSASSAARAALAAARSASATFARASACACARRRSCSAETRTASSSARRSDSRCRASSTSSCSRRSASAASAASSESRRSAARAASSAPRRAASSASLAAAARAAAAFSASRAASSAALASRARAFSLARFARAFSSLARRASDASPSSARKRSCSATASSAAKSAASRSSRSRIAAAAARSSAATAASPEAAARARCAPAAALARALCTASICRSSFARRSCAKTKGVASRNGMRATERANASVIRGTNAPPSAIHASRSASRRARYAREHRKYGDPSSACAISTSSRSERPGRSSMLSSIRRRCEASLTAGTSTCCKSVQRRDSSFMRRSHASTTRARRSFAARSASAAPELASFAEICRFAFASRAAVSPSSFVFCARWRRSTYSSLASLSRRLRTARRWSSSETSSSSSARRSSFTASAKNALRFHSARKAARPASEAWSQSRGAVPVASRPASTTHASTFRRMPSLLTSKPRARVSFASRRAARLDASRVARFETRDAAVGASVVETSGSASRFHSHFSRCSPRNASETGTLLVRPAVCFGSGPRFGSKTSPYSSRHTPRDTRSASACSPGTHSRDPLASFSFSPSFFAFPPFPPFAELLGLRFSSPPLPSRGSDLASASWRTSPNTGDRSESASGTAAVKPSARAASDAVGARSSQRSRQNDHAKRRSSLSARRSRATRSSNPRTGALRDAPESARDACGSPNVGLPTGAFASGDDDNTRSARPETPSKPTPTRRRRTPSPRDASFSSARAASRAAQNCAMLCSARRGNAAASARTRSDARMSARQLSSSAGGGASETSPAPRVQLGMPSPPTCSGSSTGASSAATAAYAARSGPCDETDASDPDARARARRVSWMLRKLAACSRKPSARGRLFCASRSRADAGAPPAVSSAASASTSSPRRARKPVLATDASRSATAKPPAFSRRNPSPRAPPSPSACSRGSTPGCCACSRSLSTAAAPSTRRRASASSNAATRRARSSASSSEKIGGLGIVNAFAAAPANSYSGRAGSSAPGGRSDTFARLASAESVAASRRSTSGSTESRGAARPAFRYPSHPGVGTYVPFRTKQQENSGNASVSWRSDWPLSLRASSDEKQASDTSDSVSGSPSLPSATSPGRAMGASHTRASPTSRSAGETRGTCRSTHRRHASSEACVPSASHASAGTPHRQTRIAPRSAAARSASRAASATPPLLSRSANARSSRTETSVSRSTAEGSRATCAFQNRCTAAGTALGFSTFAALEGRGFSASLDAALAFSAFAGGESALGGGVPSPPSTSMAWGTSGSAKTVRRWFSWRRIAARSARRRYSCVSSSTTARSLARSSASAFLRCASRYLTYACEKSATPAEVPAPRALSLAIRM